MQQFVRAFALASIGLCTVATLGASAPSGQRGRGERFKLPAGSVLAVTLATPVSSASSQVDDQVDATFTAPVTRDGVELIPAGSRLHGRVSEVVPASRKTRRGHVSLVFTVVQHQGTASRAAIRTRPIVLEAQVPDSSVAPSRGNKHPPVEVMVPTGQPLHLILAEPLFVWIPEKERPPR